MVSEDRRPLCKAISKLQDDVGLLFPKLDLGSIKIVGYSDASFAGKQGFFLTARHGCPLSRQA